VSCQKTTSSAVGVSTNSDDVAQSLPQLQNGWLSTSEPAEGLPLFLRGDDYLHHKYNGVLLMPDKVTTFLL
jgi:hypothetical protein